jgi:hypothetical protein
VFLVIFSEYKFEGGDKSKQMSKKSQPGMENNFEIRL